MSIIYILTNECMPGLVKIGRTTTSIEERMKELSRSTGVPVAFECHYAVDVSNVDAMKKIEKNMHQGLDKVRINEKREFFEINFEEAKSLLKIAENMGGKDVTPKGDVTESSQETEALEKVRKKRNIFRFSMLGIEEGTELQFKKDSTITCIVVNDSKVRFREKTMSLSESADIVLKELGYDWVSVQGSAYWCLKGKTLHDLRMDRELELQNKS